ncbi:hypothetical protein TNCV_2110821 [Trichonephila clavipes]|nr:hypothetical protein TNCV_2110821 [Trichonephila clavipes]
MKTSSVNFNAPLPMKSKHRRFALLRKIFQPWQWKRRKKRNRRSYACETMFSCGTFRMSKRCLHMMEKLSSSEEL